MGSLRRAGGVDGIQGQAEEVNGGEVERGKLMGLWPSGRS